MENLCVSRDFLTEAGISLVQVERGGNITFHGPGQLVGYPILDLRETTLMEPKHSDSSCLGPSFPRSRE